MAGSESAKRTGFEPTDPRFIELKEINGSLSVLGRCIESLRIQSQAPWREVVLTKILWEYLRGNGYVSMIVTAHICDDDYNETMRALEFAANSQDIKMRAVVNSVRPSTRNKSRCNKTPRKVQQVKAAPDVSRECSVELNFMNTCTMDQLRRIAVESYKSAMNASCVIQELQLEKVRLIDTIINNPMFNGNAAAVEKMKGIVEEEPNAMDVDMEDYDLRIKANDEKVYATCVCHLCFVVVDMCVNIPSGRRE